MKASVFRRSRQQALTGPEQTTRYAGGADYPWLEMRLSGLLTPFVTFLSGGSQMGSHMSRFTAQTLSCHHTVRSGKVPSLLYLKQGIFYYRCRLPIDLVHRLDKSEVRISLRTGHRAQALRLARDLHTRFQRALGKPNSLIFYANTIFRSSIPCFVFITSIRPLFDL